jgi:uncharacterized protein
MRQAIFGEPVAQYRLGGMYLDGKGVAKGGKEGVRWWSLAANTGQYQAQAVLGDLLFKGQSVPREGAHGLTWLMLARDAATPEEIWIKDQNTAAWEQAIPDERARSLELVKGSIEQPHSGRREYS